MKRRFLILVLIAVCLLAAAAPAGALENLARRAGVTVGGVGYLADRQQLNDGIIADGSQSVVLHSYPGNILITLDKVCLVSQIKSAVFIMAPDAPGSGHCENTTPRKHDFYIEVSEDGNSWSQVANYTNITAGWQDISFAARNVKYIRTTGTKSDHCDDGGDVPATQPNGWVLFLYEQEVWGEVAVPDIYSEAVRAFKYNGQTTDAPVAGQQATIQMDLRNAGTASSGNFTCNYYVNGALVGTENHGDMVANATHTTGITYTFPSAGSYQVRAEAVNVTGEQNTSNNSKEVTITVAAAQGDLTVTDLGLTTQSGVAAYATTATAGQSYWVFGKIQNVGTVNMQPPFSMTWYVNGAQVAVTNYNPPYTLEPNRTDNHQGLQYTFSSAGSYTLRTVISGLSGEPVTSNNEMTQSVTVVAPNPGNPDNTIVGSSGVSAVVRPYGRDASDGSGVTWLAYWPQAKFVDVENLYVAPNRRWDCYAAFDGSDLVLRANNLSTENSPGNSLQSGYTATLSGATFEDGSTTKTVILNTSSGNPGGISPEQRLRIPALATAPDIRMDFVPQGAVCVDLQGPYTTPSSIVAGTSYLLTSQFTNEGNANAGSFDITYFVNNVALTLPYSDGAGGTQRNRSGLNIGAQSDYATRYTFPSAGSYTIKAVASSPTGEVTTTNNEKIVTVTVAAAPAPELATTSITTVPNPPVAGSPTTFRVTVQNNGTVDTTFSTATGPSLGVSGGGLSGTWTTNKQSQVTIPAGQSVTFDLAPLTFPAAGSATMYFPHSASSSGGGSGSFADANSSNDLLTANVTVAPAPTPDIDVTLVSTTPSSLKAGQSFTVNFNGANTGNASATNLVQKFYMDGIQFSSNTHNATVTAGGTWSASSAATTIATAGNHTIKVVLDPASGEQNTANNAREITVAVASNPPPTITAATATYNGTTYPIGSTITGVTPMAVTFNFTASDEDGVSQWEFNHGANNGNGPSPTEASFVTSLTYAKTYTFSSAGLYRPSTVVHDGLDGTLQTSLGGGASITDPAKMFVIIDAKAPIPDIAAQSLELTPGSPEDDVSVTFTFKGKNTGNTPTTGSFTVKYYVGSTEIASKTYSSAVAAGAEFTQTATYIFPDTGTFSAKAEVSGVTGETATTNNSATAPVTVTATRFPDLTVTGIAMNPATFYGGQQSRVMPSIKNIGTAAATAFTTKYFINGVEKASENFTGSLAAGATTTPGGYLHTFASKGAYTMKVVVSGVTNEAISTNNEQSVTVTVDPEPAPDLEVVNVLAASAYGLNPSSITPIAGTQIWLTSHLKNIGNANASGYRLDYYVNGTSVGFTSPSASLWPVDQAGQVGGYYQDNPTADHNFGINYTFSSSGTYSVKCVSSNLTSDANVTNNEKTVSITVDPKPAADLDVTAVRAFKSGGATTDVTKVGQPASIQMDIYNSGNAATSGTFQTKYYVDGSLVTSENYSTLIAQNQSKTTGITYTFTTSGKHLVRAEAAGVSGEVNTANNAREITVNVAPNPPPTITAATATYKGTTYNIGQTITGVTPMEVTFNFTAEDEDGVSQWEFNHGANNGAGPSPTEAKFVTTLTYAKTYTFSSAGLYRPSTVVHDGLDATIQTALGGGESLTDPEKSFVIIDAQAPVPDVFAQSLILTPGSPEDDAPVTFTFKGKNIGTGPTSGSFTVKFFVGSTDVASKTYSSAVAAGAEFTQTATYTFPDPGNFTVKAAVSGVSGEFSTTNNESSDSVTVTATPLPDVTVTGIVMDPASFYGGQLSRVIPSIKNIGTAAATAFTTKYFINGVEKLSENFAGSLAVGATTKPGGYLHTFASDGDYTVKVVVSGVTNEGITTNNEESINFKLLPLPRPDVEMTELTVTPIAPYDKLYKTKKGTLAASYKNKGDSVTGAFKVKFYNGSTEIGSKVIASLNAGGAGSAELEYIFPAEGKVTMKAEAANILTENATTNNVKTAEDFVGGIPVEGTITTDKTEIDFGTKKPGEAIDVQSFLATIENGAGLFNLHVTSNASWFKTDVEKSLSGKVAMPRSGGIYNQTVGITDISTAGLSEATYSTPVTVTARNSAGEELKSIGTKSVTVKVKIDNPQPGIAIATDVIDLGSYKAGEAIPEKSFDIENTGRAALSVTEIKSDSTWILVSPSSISSVAAGGKSTVKLTFKTDGVGQGSYSNKVTVKSNAKDGDRAVTVKVTIISATATADLKLSASEVKFGSVDMTGAAVEQKLTVRNNGGGQFSWSITIPQSASWLKAEPSSAQNMTREQEVKLTVDPAKLKEGSQSCEIKVATSDLTPAQEVTAVVSADGVMITQSWDLDLKATDISMNGKRLSMRDLDVSVEGGAPLDLKIEMSAENKDATLAPKCAVASVKSWVKGAVGSIGKFEGARKERFNYTEGFKIPEATGIYYIAIVMGGVENPEEVAGFDRSTEHGGKGAVLGNGNDVWDITSGQWEGGNGNSFFVHDLDQDNQNRKWPCIVIKVRVKGKEPGKRRLSEGDIVIREVKYGDEPVSNNEVKIRMGALSGGSAPPPAGMPIQPGAVPPLGGIPPAPATPQSNTVRILGVLRNPSGGEKGDAVLHGLIFSTLEGGAGRFIEIEVKPGEEKPFEIREEIRPPSGDGVFYIGMILGRSEELKELKPRPLARNEWEQGMTDGRVTLILAANENRPADFAVRAVKLVTTAAPRISAEPMELILKPKPNERGVVEGKLMIRNTAGGLLEGNANASEAWIEVTPKAFMGNNVEVLVRADLAAMMKAINQAGPAATGNSLQSGPLRRKAGFLSITSKGAGNEILVPITIEYERKDVEPSPPEGSVTLLTSIADGPFPKLKWKATTKGAHYRLVLTDAKSGKIGWAMDVGDEGEIEYEGLPLIPGFEYEWRLEHDDWKTPVSKRIQVEDYGFGW